jgi:putative transposase
MGREHRSNIAGATYHVMNRGNRKQPIFEDEHDRRQFRRIWIEQQEVFSVQTLAGCLMKNHFHEVMHTPFANLSDFMQQVQGQFARYSNWRHGHHGHLFGGRFRDVHIEGNIHLLTALCYVFMNPVAAGVTDHVHDYEWSTYRATVGLCPLPHFLTIDWLTVLYPDVSVRDAQRRFKQLLNVPHPVTAYVWENEINVGPDTIKAVIRSYTGEKLQAGLLPHAYRTALRPSLDELLSDHGSDRNAFIREARVLYGYKCAEIAESLCIHPGTVSKIFRCHSRTRRVVPGTDTALAG